MKTRYPEIDIVHVAGYVVGTYTDKGVRRKPLKCSIWRYEIDGHHVRPQMGTRTEALVGLDDYAREYGIV